MGVEATLYTICLASEWLLNNMLELQHMVGAYGLL